MMGRKVLEVLDIILKILLWFKFFFFFAVKGLGATNYDLKSKTKELLQDLTLPLHLPRKIMKYMVVS